MDEASAPPPGPPPELERYGPAGGQRRTERSQEGQYKEDSYGGGRGDLAPRQDDRRDGYGRRDDGAGRSNNNYRDDRDRGTAPQGGDYRRRDSREPARTMRGMTAGVTKTVLRCVMITARPHDSMMMAVRTEMNDRARGLSPASTRK